MFVRADHFGRRRWRELHLQHSRLKDTEDTNHPQQISFIRDLHLFNTAPLVPKRERSHLSELKIPFTPSKTLSNTHGAVEFVR